MPRLSEQEARDLLGKVLALSRADACEANLNGNAAGNIRYARNTVTTAGSGGGPVQLRKTLGHGHRQRIR